MNYTSSGKSVGYPMEKPFSHSADGTEPSMASFAYHSSALGELSKRFSERLEDMRGLADFVAGGEPHPV